MTLKLEFWNSKLLVFGLNDKADDYYVFDSIFEFNAFLCNNFDMPNLGVSSMPY